MNGFLNYDKFSSKVARLNDPYWSRNSQVRWDYMKDILYEMEQIGPKTGIELGTYKISLMEFSDCMDIQPEFMDPDNRCNKAFVMDATQTPWPIPDKAYDLFVALQVMEHLSPAQSAVFDEIRRIARYAILSFPYKWNTPANITHHNISDEVIRKWTNGYPPYKIISFGSGNHCRIAFLFHFEQEEKTLLFRYRIDIQHQKKLNSTYFVPSDKRELINTWFDNIYLVNLPKRTDRLLRMLQILERLNISVEIVQAEDGQMKPHLTEFNTFRILPLGADHDSLQELINNRKNLNRPGGWGHLKTFRAILKDAMDKAYSRILILEDDDIFIHDFHKRFLELTQRMEGREWKILMLGAGQHHWNIPQDLCYENQEITAFDPSIPLYYPVRTLGTFAIALDKKVIPDYIEHLERMQWNSDRALHPVFGKHPGSCFVAIPNLIISDVSDSNITARGHQDQRTYQEKQKWDISLYEFPFQKDIVSIIVPMFNAASTIERSVRSLMRQTYREIEIIVVDDGSTDECADLVRSLGMEDSRIRLIASESNRGCYHARNLGIRSANGKYITFHDADDISLTTRIEQQLLLLIRKRVKLTITKMIRSIKDIRDKDFNSDDSLLDFVQSGDSESGNPMEPFRLIMPFGLVTSLYHRSVFEKHGLFWEERFSGDAEFLERVLFHETGLRFPFEGKTAYQYLSEKKSIEGLFEYVDSILYVCLPRSSHNLSRQYLQDGEERKSFRERYRRKLAGQEDYYYPRL